LQAPLSGVKQQRLERKVNYDKNKQNVSKWLNQVKKNRESDYVDYTVDENRTRGATLASMATDFEAKGSLEKEIEKALVKDGMATEKDIIEKEKQDLLELDPEEMKRRLRQMSKLKTLLFRQELKNKRLAKIKSKLYHKIKRKARDKQESKLLEELELVDPEAAKEYRDRIEEKRVEERISLRHGTTSKFAKNLKRYGKFNEEGTKQAYFELIRQRDELKKKTQKINDFKDDDEEDSSSGNDSDALEKLKQEALLKVNQQLSESSESDSDSNGRMDEEMLEKKKLRELKKKQNKQPGIMGMKFMQKAQQVQKEVLKQKSKMLIDEINKMEEEGEGENDDEEDDIEEQEEPKEKNDGVKKFKGEDTKTSMPSNVNLENDEVQEIVSSMKKQKKMTSEVPKDHIDKVIAEGTTEASELLLKWQGSVNKLSGKKRTTKNLTFNESEDLKDFDVEKIKNRKKIKLEDFEGEGNEEENRKIYVTNEEMEREEFEQQKQNLIQDQMEEDIADEDKKNGKPMDGWGSWAGEGITKSRTEIMREQKRKEKKIKEIKEKRRDAKKKNAIINESRDKKFTKYLVSELPHPYKSAGQFEQLMKVPLGKEWNTIASYKRLIQPEILLKAGKIIKPLKFKKDISLKAVEALVANRKDPNRPAAKF
jgi:U3 small nucleolar RNA-associated protein 14